MVYPKSSPRNRAGGAAAVGAVASAAVENVRVSTLVLFVVVTGVVLASRIPFLAAGYGSVPDAWGTAIAARTTALTGQFTSSRWPGHPTTEIGYSFVWQFGPVVMNGMTALLSALAIGCFALSMRRLGYKDAVLGSLSLAFIPVVYIFSTMSLDHVWALAFILFSLDAVLTRKPILSGLLLAIATGARLPAILLIVPFALVLMIQHSPPARPGGIRALAQAAIAEPRNLLEHIIGAARLAAPDIAKLSTASLVLSVALYVPVAMAYGPSYLVTVDENLRPLVYSLHRATIGVWGVIGLVGLALAVVSLARGRSVAESERSESNAPSAAYAYVWALVILIYVAMYIKLPYEATYLIPALPFVVLLLAETVRRSVFIVFCVLVIASPFFINVDRPRAAGGPVPSQLAFNLTVLGEPLIVDLLSGPVLSDYSARIEQMKFVDRVLAHAASVREESVVSSGWWRRYIIGRLGSDTTGNVTFDYIITPSALQQYLVDGTDVYYLPEIRDYNIVRNGIDLSRYGGRPFMSG